MGTGPVTPEELVAVARGGAGVVLSDDALAAMAASRAIIEALADDPEPHYGISTGFGALATRHIPAERRAAAAAQPDPLARRRRRAPRSSARSSGR